MDLDLPYDPRAELVLYQALEEEEQLMKSLSLDLLSSVPLSLLFFCLRIRSPLLLSLSFFFIDEGT